VFSKIFSNYSFGFQTFLQKNIGAKAGHKILVKLTKGCHMSFDRNVAQKQKWRNDPDTLSSVSSSSGFHFQQSSSGLDSKSVTLIMNISSFILTFRCLFNQHFTSSFYTRRSQKHKNNSQAISHFAFLGYTHVKAAYKHVGEIDSSRQSCFNHTSYPWCLLTILYL